VLICIEFDYASSAVVTNSAFQRAERLQRSQKGSEMNDLHGYTFEELTEGMTATYDRTVTDADILTYADLSGDTNPVHLDESYAATTLFKGRVAHGMLTASYISTVMGTKLPGPGCIYVNLTLKFRAPVRPGDRVVARATVAKLIPDKHFAELSTVCTVGDKVVLEGTATVKVPSRAG
jgi:3-hydroxybutyryl-CoA dehydratase